MLASRSPARIVLFNTIYLDNIGSDIALPCKATGNPTPDIIWLDPSEHVVGGNGDGRLSILSDGELRIRSVRWDDMGVYTCVARNSVAQDTISTFLYPMLDWNEEYCMCTECLAQLETAFAFRNLCLRSASQYNHYQRLPAVEHETPSKEYICFKCNRSFVRKLLLVTHLRTQHRDEDLMVKLEGTQHRDENLIATLEGTHLRTQQDLIVKLEEVPNTCGVCGMNFNTRYLAKRHMRNVHATEKKYQCDTCQQKFVSLVYLKAHKRYHSGERPHICSFCGKGFITGSDLYHHEKIHANKRAYKCDKCPKAFNTSSDLHKHKLCVHQDRNQWKYVCSFCNRRFPLKTNLDAHTKTHTGERNFACHLCSHRCVNRSVLLRHIKSHSNVRLFKCVMCNSEYKYQKSLDVHMKKAHDLGDAKIPERVKKYFCHVCPKSYFTNDKLQKHIRTHTGERPFSCHVCEKKFIDKSYVKQHLRTAHNISCQSVLA
ncbi:hypothetical protein FQR65_LT13630 [Abscondita terminalis]|nr:hypothetical protein FQR65_LT13630 [Abscondita terminalis]